MTTSEKINKAKKMLEELITRFSSDILRVDTLAPGHPIFKAMWTEIEKLSPSSMPPLSEKDGDCNCPACQLKNILGSFSALNAKNNAGRTVEDLLSAVGIEPKKYRGLEPTGCQCPACKIVDEMIEKNDAEITPKSAGPIEMVYDVKVPIKSEPEGRGFMYVLQEKLKATDVKVSAYNIHLDQEENPVAVSFEMILPSKRG